MTDHARLRAELLETRTRIAAIEVTADSPDGLVSVTVAGRGELRELHLDPRIYRAADPKALGASIVDTVRDAVGQSRRQLFEIVRRYLPPGAEYEHTDVHTDPFITQLDKKIEECGDDRL